MRSLSHYKIVVMRALLLLLVMNSTLVHSMDEIEAGALIPPQNNNQPVQVPSNVCYSLSSQCDKALRHPGILLIPAITSQFIAQALAIMQDPSRDNCALSNYSLVINGIYFSLMIATLILVYKKR